MRLRKKKVKFNPVHANIYASLALQELAALKSITDEQRVRRLLYGPFTRKGEVKPVRFNDLLWLDWEAISWERYPLPVLTVYNRMAGMLYYNCGFIGATPE